ncbi:hypothetical protein GQR58_029790 [Nymphon striatum]|nr:hypothetical protein GQR58_029790 [Nymphon striatum]
MDFLTSECQRRGIKVSSEAKKEDVLGLLKDFNPPSFETTDDKSTHSSDGESVLPIIIKQLTLQSNALITLMKQKSPQSNLHKTLDSVDGSHIDEYLNIFDRIADTEGKLSIATIGGIVAASLKDLHFTARINSDIVINGQLVSARVDTAADITVISEHEATKLGLCIRPAPKSSFYAENGSTLSITGYATVDLSVMNIPFHNHSIFIAKYLCAKCLLGLDILVKLPAIIDFEKRELRLKILSDGISQLDHVFGSRWLINELGRLGLSISYNEVTRLNQSVMECENTKYKIPGAFTMWVADNIDHTVATLDGKDTFHGMGIVSASTSAGNTSATINPPPVKRQYLKKAVAGKKSYEKSRKVKEKVMESHGKLRKVMEKVRNQSKSVKALEAIALGDIAY